MNDPVEATDVNGTLEQVQNQIAELATEHSVNILGGVAIFVFGYFAAKILRGVIRKMLRARRVDETIVGFVCSLSYIGLLAFVVIAGLSRIGVETTSFVAMVGAAALAIGFALQGSLSNFAAGFLLTIFRPIRVGDYVEMAGTAGTVEEIEVFTTQLKTPDNKTIIIPNARITGDNIVNYSMKPNRRVDLVIGVGYGDNLDHVRNVLQSIIDEDDRILDAPEPTIAVLELGDSSVNFAVRPWVNMADYWNVYFDVTEKVKKRFDAEGITIPFPQRDVHLFQENE